MKFDNGARIRCGDLVVYMPHGHSPLGVVTRRALDDAGLCWIGVIFGCDPLTTLQYADGYETVLSSFAGLVTVRE